MMSTTAHTTVTGLPNRIRRGAGRRNGGRRIGSHVLLIVLALYFIVPLWWLFVASTKSTPELFGTAPFWFGDITHFADNIAGLFTAKGGVYWRWIGNSFLYAFAGGVGATVLAVLAGYGFAKFSFRGKNVLFLLVMLTFLLPSQLATIPQFLMMTELGWVGELKSVIVPSLAGAFGIFWLRQFFQNSVRTELIEASTIDGCGFFRQYFHVALPSGRSAIAFLGMFTFIGSWNDFMWPLIVLNDPDRLTLQVALSQLQTTHGTDYGMLMMSALIAVVPLILVFIIGAKQFIAGITDGAVK